MRFEFQIDTDNRLIESCWVGRFTLNQANAAIDELYEHPDYDPNFRGLSDITQAEFAFQRSEISLHHGYIRDHPRSSNGPWAVLCSEPMQTALVLLYEIDSDGPHQTKAFSTLSSAREWLERHPRRS